MPKYQYDIIVIGSGSGGLSIGLFMNKAGFKVLMISKSDKDIGGDCLNDGCVPSKALIHVASIIHNAKMAEDYGLQTSGTTDFAKVMSYVNSRQEIIRKHENAEWLREQGIDVALGEATFSGINEVEVAGKKFSAGKIVIATGSKPGRLNVPGVELINYLDNESIFHLNEVPGRLLVVGGGPIGVEFAQAMSRLGSKVTLIHKGSMILDHDDPVIAALLLKRLRSEGITILLNTSIDRFLSAREGILIVNPKPADAGSPDAITGEIFDTSTKNVDQQTGNQQTGHQQRGDKKTRDKQTVDYNFDNRIIFDAVLVAVGREISVASLKPELAGIAMSEKKIVCNEYLQTTNKNVFVCGDVAGDLQFSHAAEFHARILINNFFSPFRKKLNNQHMSWVTFTDPQLATFGMHEWDLNKQNIKYIRSEQDFNLDDRAVVEDFEYGKLLLYLTPKNIFGSQNILGGTMLAPNAGELIQELILANASGLTTDAIFNKIYPYPVASRINQQLIVRLKESALTSTVKRILRIAFRIFG